MSVELLIAQFDMTKLDSTAQERTRLAFENAENELNVSFPLDYRHFIEQFGGGCIDSFLWILSPASQNENLSTVPMMKKWSGTLRQIQNDAPEDVPYPLWPDANGLVMWGVTDNGDLLFWSNDSESVVGCDGKITRWSTWNLPWGEFLSEVLDRLTTVPFFPDDFPPHLERHSLSIH